MSLNLDQLHEKAVLSRDTDWITLVRHSKTQKETILDLLSRQKKLSYDKVIIDRNLLTNLYNHLSTCSSSDYLATGGQMTWKYMQTKLLHQLYEVLDR